MHGWGSDFMVAIVLIHMVQVFLFGAYKFPRELTWIVGVFLLLLTLGMAFTGQVLRFDQDAYWGLGIGASIVSRVPWIGGPLVHFMLGGPIIGGANAVALLRAARLRHSRHSARAGRLACLDGAAPRRQRVADARPHRQQEPPTNASITNSPQRPAFPSFPMPHGRMPSSPPRSCLRHGLRASSSARSAPPAQPDPTIIQTAPKPDFAFLWIYAVLAYLPPSLETPFIFIAPVRDHWRDAAAAAGCRRRREALVAPSGRRADGRGHRRHARHLHAPRHLHAVEPDHGCMDRRSDSADVSAQTARRSNARARSSPEQAMPQLPLARRRGGMRGPALDAIAARMTEDQMIRQVLQGGGNMPAYGNALNPPRRRRRWCAS